MPVFPRDPATYRDRDRPAVGPVSRDASPEQRAEWFAELGFTVLTDEDVIDRGNYVVPREIVPGLRYEVATSYLFDLMSQYDTKAAISAISTSDVHFYHNDKYVVYINQLTKPLRIEGTWRYQYDGDTCFRRGMVGEDQYGQPNQRVMAARTNPTRLATNSTTGSVPINRDAVLVKNSEVPGNVRRLFAEAALGYLPSATQTKYFRLLDNLRSNMRARLAGGSDSNSYYQLKGMNFYYEHARTVKTLMGQFAEQLRFALNGDIDEDELEPVISLLNQVARYSGSLRDRLLNHWNTAVSSEMELVLANCGHICRDLETHDTNDGRVCEECFDEHYVHCEDTDDYRLRNHVYYHEDDEVYRTYEDVAQGSLYAAGRLSNWGASTAELMHDKSFVPSHHGDFTMGIELEVEATRSRYGRVQEAHAAFNGGSNKKLYAMFKSDGSLNSEYGFEIVTAARRLGDHIAKFKGWNPTGLRSWDAGNCGMHVHIDSRAFTGLTLGKFLMFYNMPENMEFIRDIAGRHPNKDSGAANYARAISGSATVNPVVCKDPDENESRYRMVNVTNLTSDEQDRLGITVERCSKGNYSTVEVRIFRGTLRKDRLLAQIEFAHASVAFCRVASWQELDGEAFKHWLSKTEGYPHLRRWFGAHRARNKNYTKAANLLPAAEEI